MNPVEIAQHMLPRDEVVERIEGVLSAAPDVSGVLGVGNTAVRFQLKRDDGTISGELVCAEKSVFLLWHPKPTGGVAKPSKRIEKLLKGRLSTRSKWKQRGRDANFPVFVELYGMGCDSEGACLSQTDGEGNSISGGWRRFHVPWKIFTEIYMPM